MTSHKTMDSYLGICDRISTYVPCDVRFAIACSGGVDSMFLLHLLAGNFPPGRMVVIIVDHRLQDCSRHHAQSTASIAAALGIKHCILTWNHDAIISGIEEKARTARYALIRDFCLENNIKHVVLAHHIDDKIETFFMNAMRGVGIGGIASMREVVQKHGITYIRPMLYLAEKRQIVDYMKVHNIPWFEDISNRNDAFKRNKIRKILNITANEKRNILTTIQNLEAEYDYKMALIHNLVQEHVVSGNISAEISIAGISAIPKVHFRDFILTVIFEKIYRYAKWEVRESAVQLLYNFIYSTRSAATFFKCLFYKKGGILYIVPEYRRLSITTAEPAKQINWNNVILCRCTKECDIVPLGKLDTELRKTLQIKRNFLNIAHLPAFVFEQEIAVPHLGIMLKNVDVSII